MPHADVPHATPASHKPAGGPSQESNDAPVPTTPHGALPPERPVFRRLRVYAFDPSLDTEMENAVVNQVTLKVPWEFDRITGEDLLKAGPVGEYVEVVDVDPASTCFYLPVDLDDPYVLAQDGLTPSQGNPQFHQQMVYAVAMATIRNFERALGRPVFWSPRRIIREETQGAPTYEQDQYVQRLRIYPHALREPNAYYSPRKKALLFGYFPATTSDARHHLPGGTVFTCLSHDIIAHEITHALLDGLHPRFDEPSNPDVLAFHEAFADIVALFQHFSFPDVIRHQIAKTRGDLASENLLAQLAQEFGKATGNEVALRSALGELKDGTWQRKAADPAAYQTTMEPHARGSLLVAAVFDAFISIYKSRTADLLRIATSGSGLLPAGELHPDLVNRLANEAAKSAQHVLTMCIRALDYCPPVDLTFGEYLRALITADYDLVRDDDLGYRIAVIEAFRHRGIYPRDVRNLSVDSLRWRPPARGDVPGQIMGYCAKLRGKVQAWGLSSHRKQVFDAMRRERIELHQWLAKNLTTDRGGILGLDLTGRSPKFEVHSLRPARRVGPDGQSLTDLVIEITQRKAGYIDPKIQAQVDADGGSDGPEPDFYFRGGCSILVDLETSEVRYAIIKDIRSIGRLARQRTFLLDDTDTSLRATYFGAAFHGGRGEPFAFLHRSTGKEDRE